MARPRLKINPEQVKELAEIGCSMREVGIMLGCSEDTISRRFAEIFQLGDVGGRTKLRRRQFQRAMDGSDNMLIHLGMDRLGQKSKADVTSGGEQIKTVMHFEDNGFGSGSHDPSAGGAAT